jgi:DNA-binding phage protein
LKEGFGVDKEKVYELRGLIYSKFDSETTFAKHIGWSRQRLYKITSGKKEPDINEVREIAAGLGVDAMLLVDIFIRYWKN